jgi:acid phosphatase type 7
MPARTEGQRIHLSIALAVAIGAIVLAATLPRAAAASDPVIAAAGDIACGPGSKPGTNSCHQMATSNLLVGAGLDAVLPLGDLQYERGAADAFASSYGPSWGRVKSITHPAVGNHEYGTKGAAGYFSYFGAAAGDPAKGYYSYDIGSWHLISLNSNCGSVRCGPGSPQLDWLKSDLASHRSACTLAYWHHPHFSSGPHGDGGETGDFWRTLYSGGADVVLNGHDHDYERFAPQTADGAADPAYGVREFVVGTGGRSHYTFSATKPNSQVRNDDSFGVLMLTLHAASYSWRFVPEAGKTFSDAGTDNCHAAPGTPLLRLTGSKRVRLSRSGSFHVGAQCATSCKARVQAVVFAERKRIRSRRISRTLSPLRAKLSFKFSKGKRRAVRNALRRHRRLRVTINAQARDPAGNVKKAKLSVRLQR